ncbi:MAG: DUF424 domain-containing protein [Methanocellales archaeon]
MYLKIYKTQDHILVAVCDKEILGMKICEGELEIEISERFYKGKIASTSEVIKALESATVANLFGERAVACALEKGLIEKQNVLWINGIPHAQLYRL